MLKKYFFNTCFGSVVSIADDHCLYLLQFQESVLLNKQLNQIEQKFHTKIFDGSTFVTNKVEQEVNAYCQGVLKKFTVPLFNYGTQFQQKVWNFCSAVEYGKTVTYKDCAQIMNNRLALRVVGNALAANPHAIIIPCHRIIRSNGLLGGYAGGFERKLQLVNHEQLFKNML